MRSSWARRTPENNGRSCRKSLRNSNSLYGFGRILALSARRGETKHAMALLARTRRRNSDVFWGVPWGQREHISEMRRNQGRRVAPAGLRFREPRRMAARHLPRSLAVLSESASCFFCSSFNFSRCSSFISLADDGRLGAHRLHVGAPLLQKHLPVLRLHAGLVVQPEFAAT